MGLVEIVALIGSIFKFFDQVVWFVKILEDTPQEKHSKLVVSIGEEKRSFEKTGRPKWN